MLLWHRDLRVLLALIDNDGWVGWGRSKHGRSEKDFEQEVEGFEFAGGVAVGPLAGAAEEELDQLAGLGEGEELELEDSGVGCSGECGLGEGDVAADFGNYGGGAPVGLAIGAGDFGDAAEGEGGMTIVARHID